MAENGKADVPNEDIAEGSAWEIEDQFEEFEGKNLACIQLGVELVNRKNQTQIVPATISRLLQRSMACGSTSKCSTIGQSAYSVAK